MLSQPAWVLSQHATVLLAHGEAAAGPIGRVAVLVTLVGVALFGVTVLARFSARARQRRILLWVSGVVALGVAVASPLEALAERWLVAHMVQHMLLLVVAGPLLVGANVVVPAIAALPARARRGAGAAWGRVVRALHRPGPILVVAVCHAAIMVGWHVPAWYEAALRSAAVHWLEHVMFLVAGAAFWFTVLAAGRRQDGAVLVAALTSVGLATVAGIGLGLLMTFTDTLWYPSYTGSPGLDPFTDQQLAGAVMWSAGAPLYVGGASWLLARALHAYGGVDDAVPAAPHPGQRFREYR